MPDKRGFLLFEVIVSIVVITAGLLFVMRGYSTSKEAIYRSRDLFTSSLLLEERMFEFDEKGEIKEGPDHGGFTDYSNYSWAIDAGRVENSNLNIVILDVFEREDPSGTRYSITIYLKNKL